MEECIHILKQYTFMRLVTVVYMLQRDLSLNYGNKRKQSSKQNSPQMTGTRLHTENHKHEMQRLTHVTSSWLKITKARQQRR